MQRPANAAGYASATGCIGANRLPYCAQECGRPQPQFQMQAHVTQHAAKKCDARPDSLLDGRTRTKSPKSMRNNSLAMSHRKWAFTFSQVDALPILTVTPSAVSWGVITHTFGVFASGEHARGGKRMARGVLQWDMWRGATARFGPQGAGCAGGRVRTWVTTGNSTAR